MNRDSRNVLRGKCKTDDCDCSVYNYNSNKGNDCDYCRCPPTKHENLDILDYNANLNPENGENQQVVPLIVHIDENIFMNEYLDLLREIEKAFKFLHAAYDRFLEIYPIWRKNRLEKIRALKDLADCLDSLRFKCNVTKITASSAALSGGILTVIASLCLFLSAPVAIPLIPLAAVGIASSVVDGCAVVIENIKERKSLKIIKQIYDEDKEHCAALVDFIECGKKCNAAIEKLMDFDTFQKLWNMLAYVNNDNVSAQDLHERLLSYVSAQTEIPELKKFLKLCPTLLSLLHNTLTMQRSNPKILQSINLSSKLCLESANFVDSAFDLTSLMVHSAKAASTTGQVAVKSAGKIAGKATVKAAFHGGIAGVCLIFDVVNLHLTVKDMKNGSKSQVSRNIRAVVSYMEGDIEKLDSVYQSVAKYKLEQSVYGILTRVANSQI